VQHGRKKRRKEKRRREVEKEKKEVKEEEKEVRKYFAYTLRNTLHMHFCVERKENL